MLVLTRKSKEQIRIGDNITITVVRLQGNSVRIGIDAPRELRVVRGELAPIEIEADEASVACSDLEEVFAHPQPKPSERPRIGRPRDSRKPASGARKTAKADQSTPTRPQLFVGSVDRDGGSASVRRAPLSRFMSAT